MGYDSTESEPKFWILSVIWQKNRTGKMLNISADYRTHFSSSASRSWTSRVTAFWIGGWSSEQITWRPCMFSRVFPVRKHLFRFKGAGSELQLAPRAGQTLTLESEECFWIFPFSISVAPEGRVEASLPVSCPLNLFQTYTQYMLLHTLRLFICVWSRRRFLLLVSINISEDFLFVQKV